MSKSQWESVPTNFGTSYSYLLVCSLLTTIHSLAWIPIAFTFSFSSKELQANPIDGLRSRFEQLDIKLLVDYNIDFTTHVVAKKRNTAKGLQALLNGKFIVTESFLDAVSKATEPVDDGNGSQTCALEQNFDESWPDPMMHLPPRGGEPFEHPDQVYTPDKTRLDVFEGYTFIFYDATQYNNLLAPITNGGGKALVERVVPGETSSDDFVRYVKSVAGEKGMGSFDDGSEGKGAVVVRFLPAKGDQVQWYTEFITAVSLRLDHRPIEQNKFLEAILIKDASILRRPLEVEEQSGTSTAVVPPTQPSPELRTEPEPTTRRPRIRKPVKRRFMGFDDGSDVDMDDVKPIVAETIQPAAVADEGGLFVSQESHHPMEEEPRSNISQKRTAPVEDDLMAGMAPAAARFKRQKMAMGGGFAAEEEEDAAPEPAKPAKKKKQELNILAEAAKHREAQEARAKAEQEDLAQLPDDIDLAEIRRLNIVEEMELRKPEGSGRTREQDIADGRWDPKWNGIKNFKKFRRRGEASGRQPARTIIALDEVQSKTFGVGDDYWLEEEAIPRTNPGGSRLQSAAPRDDTPPAISQISSGIGRSTGKSSELPPDTVDDSDVGDAEEEDSQPPRPSYTRRSVIPATASSRGTRSQSSGQTSQSLGKRSAADTLSGQSSKRRPPPQAFQVDDSDDDSDDELKFRFGRRR